MKFLNSLVPAGLLLLAAAAPGCLPAQAPSLRPVPAQYEASARLYGARDYAEHSIRVERREQSNVTKGAMIGGGAGAVLGTLFLLGLHDGMDGSGTPFTSSGVLFIFGSAAIGAFLGAAIGAGFD